MAVAAGLEIVIHAPKEDGLRDGKRVRMLEPRPYLARNREIVRCRDLLIAAPAESIDQVRSGTWSTVHFARNQGRPVWVIRPGGRVTGWSLLAFVACDSPECGMPSTQTASEP